MEQIQNISFVTETLSVRSILAHIGEPTRPPVISPARAPPASEEDPIPVDLGYDPLAQSVPKIEFDQRIQS